MGNLLEGMGTDDHGDGKAQNLQGGQQPQIQGSQRSRSGPWLSAAVDPGGASVAAEACGQPAGSLRACLLRLAGGQLLCYIQAFNLVG